MKHSFPLNRNIIHIALLMAWPWMASSVSLLAQDMNVVNDLTKGLLLYLPFEGSAAPRFCMGPAEVKTGAGLIGDGRVGRGFCVAGNASVSLPAIGNFDRRRGTIAFWHLPHWKPQESGPDNPELLKAEHSNFQLIWYRPNHVLFFMTGNSERGVGFRWDYSVAAKEPMNWAQPQWHHFAITWDSATGEKQIFLDGRLASQGKTKWIRTTSVALGEDIVLGSPAAPGLYDEWAIWNRVLPESEIALLAGQPPLDHARGGPERVEGPEVGAKSLGSMKPPEELAAPITFELARLEPTQTIVNPGETFHLPVTAINKTPQRLQLTLRLSLLDVFGGALENRTQDLDLQPSGKRPLTFDLRAQRNGVYKLRAEFDANGHSFRKDLGGFAVWPEGLLKPSPDSFFGHHVNSWAGGALIKQAGRLGLSWQRDHDMLQATWWIHVQPEQGEPKWENDFQLDFCKQARLSVLGEFFATPYWAATTPQTKPQSRRRGDYPRNPAPRMDAFEDYVRLCAAHYKDYIHVWEVWNEPDCSIFWKGTPEEYGKLAQAACRAAKAADPTCKVLVGAFTSATPTDWLERAAKSGAFTDADGFSFHGYAENAKTFRQISEMMRDAARRYLPPDKAGELWDTEWGTTDTTFYVDADLPGLPAHRLLPLPSFLEGAANVVKMDCISMVLGVKRSFYYLQNDVSGPTAYSDFSTLECTRVPRPKLIARTALEWLTRGARFERLLERAHAKGLTAIVFSRSDGGSLAVVWLEEDTKAALSLRPIEGAKVLDLFGNELAQDAKAGIPISPVPVYIATQIPALQLSSLLEQANVEIQQ